MAFELNETDYNQLQIDLDDFLDNSEAQAVLLCDRGGNIIVHSGDSVTESIDLISALVAGSYAATKELAAILGEDEFTAIHHQGTNTSIFISAVGEEVLLLALFSDETNASPMILFKLGECEIEVTRPIISVLLIIKLHSLGIGDSLDKVNPTNLRFACLALIASIARLP